MFSLIKYVQGYVYAELTGYAPERFLNLCGNHDILIWNLKPDKDGYFFCISVAGFRRLKPILRKTKTRIRVIKRYGLPFVLFRYRGRKLFACGILICAVLLKYLSGFIWNIEINGNSYLSEETVLDFLSEEDASFGSPIRKISCEDLEEALRTRYDEVIWTSIQIFGTKMTVDIQENLLPAEQYEKKDDTVYDIVAAKDGIITQMITRTGTPAAAVGAEVKKGDLLVSGRIEIENDDGEVAEVLYHGADADIVAQVSYTYRDVFDETYVESVPTGQSFVDYQLIVGETCIKNPFVKNGYEEYSVTSESSQLHVTDNFYLPVFLVKSTCTEVVKTEKTYDKNQAKIHAAENLAQFLEDLEENGIQIIRKNVMIEKKNGTYVVTGTIDAYESIVAKTPTDITTITDEENTTTDESD